MRFSADQALAASARLQRSSQKCFGRKTLASAAGVMTAGFIGLFAGSAEASPYPWRGPWPGSPPAAPALAPYSGVRGQLWKTAQNCIEHAKLPNPVLNKWVDDCWAPSAAVAASESEYSKRYIFNWDNTKKQVLLIPFDYISGVEANDLYSKPNVLLPDYWTPALATLDSQFTGKHPFYAPDNGGYGVAMNSANFRTRDQLHLHICTVESDVIGRLRAANLGNDFQDLRDLKNHHWWAKKIAVNDNIWEKTFFDKFFLRPDYKANVSIAVIKDLKSNFWLLYNQQGMPAAENGAGAETLLQDKCNGAELPK
jgi:CDP-diacylglycerol pyrophosphatase